MPLGRLGLTRAPKGTPKGEPERALSAPAEGAVRLVPGRGFEDILDGYFPLRETIGQMMRRHGFALAFVDLLHAPVMDIPGLSPDEPVPFRIRKEPAGMIDWMRVEARRDGDGLVLRGQGSWWWLDAARDTARFSPLVRLGEPAFVRGVGLMPDGGEGGTGGDVASLDVGPGASGASAVRRALRDLGWTQAQAYALPVRLDGIEKAAGAGATTGVFDAAPSGAGGPSADAGAAVAGACVLVRLPAKAVPPVTPNRSPAGWA